MRWIMLLFMGLLLFSCDPNRKLPGDVGQVSDEEPTVVGSLAATLNGSQPTGLLKLDTLTDTKGLYGLGPAAYLNGELLIFDGRGYRSGVIDEQEMKVTETLNSRTSFFIYTHQNSWAEYTLPDNVRTLPQIDEYLGRLTVGDERSIVFRIAGKVKTATIQVPIDIQRKQRYKLDDEEVDLLGFYRIGETDTFTLSGNNVQTYLLSRDRERMGQVVEVSLGGGMKLFLPE